MYQLKNTENEKKTTERDGIEEGRFWVLLNAFEFAVKARRVFNPSHPKENLVHKFQEVRVSDLS